MRAYTTEDFLRSKLSNMKEALSKHGANSERLDQMEARIRSEQSITAYACKLNDGRDHNALADKLVGFCEVPAKKREAAMKCVLSYLICFAESTWSISSVQ